jgi:SAM-dependent methyltransferase
MALLGMAFSHKTRATHFDELSPEYDAQIPFHIRQLLVHRKAGRMITLLSRPRGLRGLDIGCGQGWLLAALREAGANVTGLDLSAAQARAARQTGAAVIRAGATELPFGPESFDFAYAVNIVHHLPSVRHQRLAFQEAARVLKPGGLFFLHEINVANPIFRFYMGYVFPLIRRIDEGTELWLDPDSLPLGPDLRVEHASYFTFVPDFLPSPLLRLALPLEEALEKSRWARYSAHFMVALRKEKPEV